MVVVKQILETRFESGEMKNNEAYITYKNEVLLSIIN